MKKIDFGGMPSPRPNQSSPDKWVADRLAKPVEPINRLSIDVTLSLHQTVKSRSAMRGENMAEVIRGLLGQHFSAKATFPPQLN